MRDTARARPRTLRRTAIVVAALGTGGALFMITPAAHAAFSGAALLNQRSASCMTVRGGSNVAGTPAEINACNGTESQRFTTTAAGEVRVTLGGQVRCLDASGGGDVNGTRIIVWTCQGSGNQMFTHNANNSIRGNRSGRCLDINGGATTPGTPIVLWDCKNGGNGSQTWTPNGTPPPPPPPNPPPGGGTCAVKSRPAGKVLQGYWENWDGAVNGVHPPQGWMPITDARIRSHGYNVINAAFPVIRSDGTVLWEDGMDATVKVATPAEMCQAKAAGATILLSIGGAAAGIDLGSAAVADRFVATVVPILRRFNFDGIDIDIETGLTGSGNINQLSVSQANLVRIIDGVLGQMPANFGLTMAPETAYVTGGSVTYGSIWGAYLPIVKRYADNGRLWWLNMQYYNGNMYGCAGDSYAAATVQGFTVQTNCLNSGLVVQGTTIRVPLDKQVPGLPAQPGAGGGQMPPAMVAQCWNAFGNSLKGLMTWSINWDGSKGWTFGDNVRTLQGR